jgi:hypothetical protein
MRVQFSKCVAYVPDWNDNKALPEAERVTTKLNVLAMGDLLLLMDTFQKQGIEGKVDSDSLASVNLSPILNQVGTLVPKYCQISGLSWEDGSPVSADDVASVPNFLHLAAELLMKLAEISTPSEADEKNLNAPRS